MFGEGRPNWPSWSVYVKQLRAKVQTISKASNLWFRILKTTYPTRAWTKSHVESLRRTAPMHCLSRYLDAAKVRFSMSFHTWHWSIEDLEHWRLGIHELDTFRPHAMCFTGPLDSLAPQPWHGALP